MSEPSDLPIASLRRLAYGLLYDEQRAEDAVQDAWLAALRGGGAASRARGWLAEAVRRIARSRARDELRRESRERRAARPEGLPSVADSSARVEVLRRVLDAVDALEPAYRDAIVLRYFDELPPRAIARRLGIPVNTARTHVRRGLERLRRQLDERGRGREELLAALAPLAGASGSGGIVGGIGVKAIACCVGGGVVVGLGALGAWSSRSDGRTVAPAAPVASAAPETSADVLAPAAAGGARAPLGAPAPLVARDWTVRGFALKGRREAYPGARLVGRVWNGPSTSSEPAVEERFVADDDGTFAWSLPAPGACVAVRVEPADEDSGTGGTAFDVFLPGDPPPERWFVRACPLDGTLRGVVRDDDGRPVAGARVVHDRWKAREDVTDADGRYEVPTSSARDSLELWVIADGFALEQVQLRDFEPGERTRDVHLRRGLVVRGRVLDEGGAPLAGARVFATHPPELAGATSGPDGAFELANLALDDRGEAWLYAEAPGALGVRQRVLPGDGDGSGEVELRLARAFAISGRVLAPDGAPLEGVEVCASPFTGTLRETWTDAEGRFRIEPPWGGSVPVWFWRRGFAQQRVDVAPPEGAAGVEGLEVVLGPSRFLGGVVLGLDGAPAPFTFVYAQDPAVDEDVSRFVEPAFINFAEHADASGRFRFDGLPDARVRLEVHVPGLPPLHHEVESLDRDDVVLRLSQAATLAGLVLDDATGAPVESFALRVLRHEQSWDLSELNDESRAFEGPSGEWSVDNGKIAPGAAFTVEVTAAGYAPGSVRAVASVARDPSACVLRLRRGSRITGRVVDHASGAPISGARVEWKWPWKPRHPGDALVARSDSNGAFELAGVPPGPALLDVRDVDVGVVDGPFTVVDGEDVERWVELGGGGRVHGRLVDEHGNALAGERVRAHGAAVAVETREWTTTTGGDGSFELADLPAGIFQVTWERERDGMQFQVLVRRVQLAPGESLELDLSARGDATVRGEVAVEGAADGDAPPRLARVSCFPKGGAPLPWADGVRGGVAVDGRFEVSGLTAGTWVVLATCDDPVTGETLGGTSPIEVPASGTVETRVVVDPN